MKFGQIIRKLRLDADMTQERLSELLCISPQAVSRWETGIAMPDIALLPSLANLFHVTTDYLLGMDTYEKDGRREEYEAAWKDYWKAEDKEACYQMAAKAATEYPGEMKYMEWLASSEYFWGMQQEEPEYGRLLEQSIRHYKLVLKQTSDKVLWDNALRGIVMALHDAGKNEQAREYAQMQEEEQKRDELLNWCLEGNEKAVHSQKMLDRKLGEFLWQIKAGGKRMEAYETVEQVLKVMIPDGNYVYYHNILQYNHIDKAFLFCNQKQYEEAIEELKRARYHAEEMGKLRARKSYQYTAPLFDRLSGEVGEADSQCTDLDDFVNCLNKNRCFDPVRGREDFKALMIK